MEEKQLVVLCQYLAEQSYMNHLLAKKLIDAGLLRSGELQQMYEADPLERQEFFQDFLRKMKNLGLQV